MCQWWLFKTLQKVDFCKPWTQFSSNGLPARHKTELWPYWVSGSQLRRLKMHNKLLMPVLDKMGTCTCVCTGSLPTSQCALLLTVVNLDLKRREDVHMAGVLFSVVTPLMNIWCAGRCGRAGWLCVGRANWEPAKDHLQSPFPFGSAALFLSHLPLSSCSRHGSALRRADGALATGSRRFLKARKLSMWFVNLFCWPTGIPMHNYLPGPDGCHTCWLPAQLQVTVLTASKFYRNAHLSGICFSSWGLALFFAKAICNSSHWTRSNPALQQTEWMENQTLAKYIIFLMVILRGTQQSDLTFQGDLTVPLTWYSYLMAFFYMFSSAVCSFQR